LPAFSICTSCCEEMGEKLENQNWYQNHNGQNILQKKLMQQ
jgi:hypothetical protein